MTKNNFDNTSINTILNINMTQQFFLKQNNLKKKKNRGSISYTTIFQSISHY